MKKTALTLIAAAVAAAVTGVQASSITVTDRDQSFEWSETIEQASVQNGYTLAITGQNILLEGSGDYLLKAETGHQLNAPLEDLSTISIGTAETETVRLIGHGTTGQSILNKGGSLEIRGKNISIESSAVEALRTTSYGKTVIGGAETELISVKNDNGDGLCAVPISGWFTTTSETKLTATTIDIDVAGYGIWAQNSASDGTSRNYTTLEADNIHIDAGKAALLAISQAVLTLDGNTYIKAPTLLVTRGDAITTFNESEKHVVQVEGDVEFNYDGPTSGTTVNAEVLLNLTTSDSYWKGTSYVSWNGRPSNPDKLVAKNLTVKLSNGAVWMPTPMPSTFAGTEAETGIKYSAVNHLIIENGIVDLVEGGAESITIDEISGSGGTFNVPVTVVADGFETPTVNITSVKRPEAQKPATNLVVTFEGITADDIRNIEKDLAELSPIQVAEGEESHNAYTQTKIVAEGAIKGEITQVETVDEDGHRETVDSQKENRKLASYSSIYSLGALQWRHEMNDVTKRMGELRDAQGTVGAWARLYGSEQEYGSQSVTAKNTTIQAGGDFEVANGWKLGGAFSYTDGSTEYALGSGDSDMFGFAVYGTWLADNGAFLDLIGKYTRISNEFKANDMSAEYDNNAFSFSAEVGHRFEVAKVAFVEPQLEVSYGRVAGDAFTATNGVTVEQDDFDSLIGRAGMRAGFVFPENRGTIYARASVLHDFKGDVESTARLGDQSEHLKDELGGTWYEFGVGANFSLSDSTYTYVDLERTTGGEVVENWRWNVGIRHAF